MPAMLRHHVSRFIVTTALAGSLIDWVMFATMVVTVDQLLGSTPWATAIVLIARIIPGVVFAPVAARRIDRGDLLSSLRLHEVLRVGAVAGLAVSFAAETVVGVIAAIVVMEFAAAMQAAGREAAISRHVPSSLFTSVNTATAVISYGLLPVGPLIVGVVGPEVGWGVVIVGGALIAASYLLLRLPVATAAAADDAAVSADGVDPATLPAHGDWKRITVAAAFGVVPAVALFTLGPDFAETWLGSRASTGPLYAMVLGGGAVGFALANTRHFRAELAMLIAAAGVGAMSVPGLWAGGLVALGLGAGGAYLDLQTRLQHAASDPSEFAAAFATLKIATGAAVLGAPALARFGGLAAVLVVGAGVAVVGAGVSAAGVAGLGALVRRVGRRPGRAAQLAVREVFAVLLRLTVRVRVTNPDARVDGPAVIVSNHPNWLDGAVVVLADRSLRPVARWQAHRGARLAIWAGNAVVTTARTDREPRPAWEQAADHLRTGGRIWLAPEGGAHSGLELLAPRSGAVRMAHAASVPVQPLGIRWRDGHAGPDLRRWRPWRRPTVDLVWGAAVTTSGDVDHDNDAMMARLAAASGVAWAPDPAPAPALTAVA